MYLEKGNWVFQLIEEWSQLWTECNWYTATAFQLEFENDAMLGGYELTFVILGLGFRIRWNHTETEELQDIKARVEEVKSGEAEVTQITFK